MGSLIFLGVTAIFFIGLVIIKIITKKVKKGKCKYIREKYAFYSVICLITLAGNVTVIIASDYDIYTIILLVLGIDNPVDNKIMIFNKFLVFLIFIICCVTVYKTHKEWNGKISQRQYILNTIHMTESGLFSDSLAYLKSILKQNKELIEYRDFSNINFDQENENNNELAWNVEYARIFSVKTNQTRIANNDWHADHHCYISTYANKNKIAIYCSIDIPAEDEILDFLNYIHKCEGIFLTIIIAIKENIYKIKNFSKKYNNYHVEFKFKDNELDDLIDFHEYYKNIEVLYNKPLLENSKKTIADVYVEPKVKIGISNDECEYELYDYVESWLSEVSCRQLALLGEFGQGKTVFTIKLAYQLIKNKSIRIPILIPLRNKSPRNSTLLEIFSYFSSQYGINPEALEILNKNGRLLLIFDGFDEMDLVGNDDIRKIHFKSLWKLVTPNSKMFITGRPNYFLDATELSSALGTNYESKDIPYCEDLFLLPFNAKQIEYALRNSEKSVREEMMKVIRNNESKSFVDLISRPSQLFLVSELWNKRNLATRFSNLTSATIINEFLQNCFEQQSSKGGMDSYFFLSSIEREYFMIGIAVKMYKTGITSIPRDLFVNTVSELIEVFPDKISLLNPVNLNLRNGKSVKDFAYETKENLFAVINDVRTCGVIVNDYVNDGFTFGHKSFHDLLVAKYFLGKELKTHDEIMSISSILGSLYNVHLKNDLVIRKLLAELIAYRIKFNNFNNYEDACSMIFNKCYSTITKKHIKTTPQKLFYKYLNQANMEKSFFDLVKQKKENRGIVLIMFFLCCSILLFVIISSYYIYQYKNSAYDEMFFRIDNKMKIPLYYFSYLFYVIYLCVIIFCFKKRNVNADIVLLTWYYCCRENNISDEQIYQYIPVRLKSTFDSFLRGENLNSLINKRKRKIVKRL